MKKSRDDVDDAMQDGEGPQEIGVSEYFVAQRAARKMIEFLRIQQGKRAEEKLKKVLTGDDDELEVVVPDPTKPKPTSIFKADIFGGKPSLNAEEPEKEKPKRNEPIEEESSDSDGNHSEKVKRFLQDLQKEINSKPGEKKNGDELKTNMAMAMLNLHPAQNRNLAGSSNGLQVAKIPSIMTVDPSKIHLQMPSQRQNSQAYSGVLTDESRLDDLLDIDKVIGAAEQRDN
jgi:hypothetical protein